MSNRDHFSWKAAVLILVGLFIAGLVGFFFSIIICWAFSIELVLEKALNFGFICVGITGIVGAATIFLQIIRREGSIRGFEIDRKPQSTREILVNSTNATIFSGGILTGLLPFRSIWSWWYLLVPPVAFVSVLVTVWVARIVYRFRRILQDKKWQIKNRHDELKRDAERKEQEARSLQCATSVGHTWRVDWENRYSHSGVVSWVCTNCKEVTGTESQEKRPPLSLPYQRHTKLPRPKLPP